MGTGMHTLVVRATIQATMQTTMQEFRIPAFAEDALRGSELFRCSKSESIVYLRYAAEAPVGRTSRQLVSQSVLLVLVLVVSVPIALFH